MNRPERTAWYVMSGGHVTTEVGPHWAEHVVVYTGGNDKLAACIAVEHNVFLELLNACESADEALGLMGQTIYSHRRNPLISAINKATYAIDMGG